MTDSHIYRTCYTEFMSLPKNLKDSPTEEHDFMCSLTARSHPPPPSPHPSDVIYGANKDTFTLLSKTLTGKMYKIHALKHDHLGIFQAI